HVIRRIGTPPALPLVVRPGSAHRSEHVAAHDPGAEILELAYREVVVDAGRPAISPQDVLLEGPGWNKPLMQSFAAAAERLVTTLVGAGAEAVGRHRKSVHAKPGHGRPSGRCAVHGRLAITPRLFRRYRAHEVRGVIG